MQLDIFYRPSYSLAVIKLNPGEGIQAEAGAMVSMSPTIKLKTEMKGGFMGALKRKVLGGKASSSVTTWRREDRERSPWLPQSPATSWV